MWIYTAKWFHFSTTLNQSKGSAWVISSCLFPQLLDIKRPTFSWMNYFEVNYMCWYCYVWYVIKVEFACEWFHEIHACGYVHECSNVCLYIHVSLPVLRNYTVSLIKLDMVRGLPLIQVKEVAKLLRTMEQGYTQVLLTSPYHHRHHHAIKSTSIIYSQLGRGSSVGHLLWCYTV